MGGFAGSSSVESLRHIQQCAPVVEARVGIEGRGVESALAVVVLPVEDEGFSNSTVWESSEVIDGVEELVCGLPSCEEASPWSWEAVGLDVRREGCWTDSIDSEPVPSRDCDEAGIELDSLFNIQNRSLRDQKSKQAPLR
jgi:hypothetical protein